MEPGPDHVSYPSGSRVTQLLERISEVVEQNRFFTPDRPGLGQDLETLQQQLESLSAAPLPPDYSFNRSQGQTLFSFTFTNNKLRSLTKLVKERSTLLSFSTRTCWNRSECFHRALPSEPCSRPPLTDRAGSRSGAQTQSVP